MIRNALYIQSGGPTAVINASAYGVILECRRQKDRVGRLYAAKYGNVGVLQNQLMDIGNMQDDALERLLQTPSMAFGSCRYRMVDFQENDRDYRKYLQVLQQHDIGYLFLNGGNGTLASAAKLKKYLSMEQYDCKVIAIPKTVDNDIEGIDHSPGYPSSARYVILSISELAHDIRSYDTGLITVVEVMGRNTGWLAAASLAAGLGGHGPDLIYVPEVPFSHQTFLENVQQVYVSKGKCLVVVAEGIQDEAGQYVHEQTSPQRNTGTPVMGGVALQLADFLRNHFDCKVRAVNLDLMQRCATHALSALDVREAVSLGERAVREALNGHTGKMVSLVRRKENRGGCSFVPALVDLAQAASSERRIPSSYITENGCFIKEGFLDYVLPLVGELPVYANISLLP